MCSYANVVSVMDWNSGANFIHNLALISLLCLSLSSFSRYSTSPSFPKDPIIIFRVKNINTETWFYLSVFMSSAPPTTPPYHLLYVAPQMPILPCNSCLTMCPTKCCHPTEGRGSEAEGAFEWDEKEGG